MVPSNALWVGSPTENLCDYRGYTVLGRLEPGVRIGINGVGNPVDTHAYLWRYHLRQLQEQARDVKHFYLYDSVNDHVDAILSRPGRYAELVAALFPDAPLVFALDPTTSLLGPEYLPNVSTFADSDNIYEEDVARWMYAVLKVSREAARLELEPYFRRRAHYNLAVQAWRDTLIRGTISADSSTSMSLFISRAELERRFHTYKPFAYPVRRTTLFMAGSDVVAWDLPDDDDPGIEDVAVDFSWLPSCIADRVVARYRELCIVSDV